MSLTSGITQAIKNVLNCCCMEPTNLCLTSRVISEVIFYFSRAALLGLEDSVLVKSTSLLSSLANFQVGRSAPL